MFARGLHSDAVRIGILGVPFDKGQPKVGVGNGPSRIRKAGLAEQLSSIGEVKKIVNIVCWMKIIFR